MIGPQAGPRSASSACTTSATGCASAGSRCCVVIGVLVVGISLLRPAVRDRRRRRADGREGDRAVSSSGRSRRTGCRPGRRVRFDVTSVDVNHGFGLYDPHGHLIGSVQAMPGLPQQARLDADRGRRLPDLCFELCGVNHSTMQNTFTVTRTLMEAGAAQHVPRPPSARHGFTARARGIERRIGLLFAGDGNRPRRW